MTTTAVKPKRLRRVLFGFAIVCFIIFVGFPTALILRTRQQISSALHSASAVRLEEFDFNEKVLTTRTLASAEYQHIADALPFTVEAGIPGLIAMCFIPHHRVVITRPDHSETIFAVCFSCEQVQLSGSDIMFTPHAWKQLLRQLFLRHDIPIRDSYTPAFLTESE